MTQKRQKKSDSTSKKPAASSVPPTTSSEIDGAMKEPSTAVNIIVGAVVIMGLLALVIYMSLQGGDATVEATITTEENPSWGNPDAAVKVIEFANYTCGHCATAAKIVEEEIRPKYEDDIFYVYKDFPFEENSLAFQAAIVARCAQQQGKFWEVSHLLFAEQGTWARSDDVITAVEEVGVRAGADEAELHACFQQQLTAPLVKRDMDEARALGLKGTPTFFVNEATATYETLDTVIAEELAKSGG